ncbi:MAG: mechanosensitive ion channel family protein [Thermoplasmata archaeon]|nr:mechanosensitive ion channel family protein [Thermoplasmata archaeon]
MSWQDELRVLEFVLAVAIAVGGYVLSRVVASALRRQHTAPHWVRGTRIAIRVVSIGIAAAILATVLPSVVPLASGLTVSAIIGLAATYALQTTIQNVISGYILLRNRVVRLNDEVRISDVSGKVVQLGLVTTWLRLEDGSLATVSNSTMLSGPLVNRSAAERLKGEY